MKRFTVLSIMILCTLYSAGPAAILDTFSAPSPGNLDISRHFAGRSAWSALATLKNARAESGNECAVPNCNDSDDTS